MIDLNAITNAENNFGPLQILHDFQFVPLNVSEDYSFLKNLTNQQKMEHMTGRLKRLSDCGYGGVVLNVDFENYLKNEQSFAVLDKVIDAAHDLNLRVWLYDEQYYPSGSAGGLVLDGHPELEGQGLVCVKKEVEYTGAAVRIPSPCGHSELKYAFAVPEIDGKYEYSQKINISNFNDIAGGLCWDCKGGKWLVYCYFVRALYEMTYLAFSFRASRRYPSIADKRAIRRFISITYKDYEKYLKKPLGKRAEAIFTDEPSLMFYLKYPDGRNPDCATQYDSISVYDKPDLSIPAYPYVPWCCNIEQEFYEAYGYEISEFLPELFDNTGQTEKIRIDFYGLINRMVENAYMNTYCEYAHLQGMMLSGHYLREECFNRHPFMYGDILRHIGRMDIPGCDMLFSSPDELRYSLACKLASSAAHIYHKEHAMIEASNMLDKNQNFTADNMVEAISIIFAHGIDTITSYYGEKIFDDEDTKKVTHYISRLSKLFNGGKNRIAALLYYPFEQLCAARIPDGPEFDETTMLDTLCVRQTAELLFKRQVGYDFINREKLLKCRICNGYITTDYSECVNTLVFPEISFVDSEVAQFLNKAHDYGIDIVFYGNERDIGGLGFVPRFEKAAKQLSLCSEKKSLYLKEYSPYIVFLHKSVGCREIYLLVNTGDTDEILSVSVPYADRTIYKLDLLAKEVTATQIECTVHVKCSQFKISLKSHRHIVFCIE